MKFDTIVSNPPHFKSERPGGYRSENEMLISLDGDMRIHKSIFENAKNTFNECTNCTFIYFMCTTTSYKKN